MAFILYGYERNPRSRVIRIVAAAEGIDLNHFEVVPRRNINRAEYISRFPRSRGKIPALEGPNVKLTETLAITMYLAKIHNRLKLFGNGSPEETAEILSWASWANQEFLQIAAQWFLPLIPSFTTPAPYNKEAVEAGKKATVEILEFLEGYLQTRTYLATENFTVADIMLAIYLSRLFEWVLGSQWREAHPAIMRYWEIIVGYDAVTKVIRREDFIFCEEETTNVDPALNVAS